MELREPAEFPNRHDAWSDFADLFSLTPSEARLMRFLSDGEMHTADECLRVALRKRFATQPLIPMHMRALRKKIQPFGFSIISHQGRPGYVLIAPKKVGAP